MLNTNSINVLQRRTLGFRPQEAHSFINTRFEKANSLFCKDLKGHFGCVNAIEFSSNGGEWIASGIHYNNPF